MLAYIKMVWSGVVLKHWATANTDTAGAGFQFIPFNPNRQPSQIWLISERSRKKKKNVEVPLKGKNWIQRTRPTRSLMYGVLSSMQCPQGQRIQPCLPGSCQAPHRRFPTTDHCHFRQRRRGSFRCHFHSCTGH